MAQNDTKQPTPGPPDERSEVVRALGEQYAERQRALENYVLSWFTTFGLLRRFGISPLSRRGRLTMALLFMLLFLVPPLIVTAVTGQWAAADIQRWTIVAVTFGVAGVLLYDPYFDVLDDILSLHRAMIDESGLRRLIAWSQRCHNIRTTIAVDAAFGVGTIALLFWIQRPTPTASISVGTIVIGVMLLCQVGEIAFYTSMWGVESRILVAYNYDLYRLSPIDSAPLRRSLRGYNRGALLNSVMATLFIIEFAILLPADSSLIVQIALVLLVITYLSVGVGFVLPRLAMRQIIQAHKEREMAPLQHRLNHLSGKLRELTDDEYEEMKRLEETHDKIRNSSENVLPIGVVGQIVGTLLLPTVTFVAAVASEVYLSRLLERLVP